ncbi:MAG TPA: hypothetical protein VNS12_12165 [Pelagibacterium sp.]|uniref:hypothetical protein n=1 Tax=Pelagibacterium sp. TaxID=1967288 RepID=UPI002C8169A4|nr:hypothetical protein [Pelagibacterium sp.]HWJ88820.1 hypothetical protein [Pelagibacterium sp.]
MNFLKAAVLVAGLAWTTEGRAQIAPVLSSTVGVDWTSNAEASPVGASDIVITQSHSVGIAGGGEGKALRGSLTLEETRFGRLWRENDWTATLALDGETALGAGAGLRGSLSLAYSEEGQVLATLAGPLGAVTPSLSGRAQVRLETRLHDAAVGIDLDYAGERPGDTRLEADIFPKERIRPVTDTVTVGLDMAHPVTDTLLLLGRAQYVTVLVSPDEQARFGRVPVDIGRVAAGVEIASPGAVVGLRGGFDAIFSRFPTMLVPYGLAEGRIGLGDGVELRAAFRVGADTEDPADGVVDWRLKARGSIVFTPTSGTELELAAFAAQRYSPLHDITIETETGAELLARLALAGGLMLEGRARYRYVEALAGDFSETRLGLRLAAVL